jgi:DNA polymerase III subunit gamma/tau
MEHLALYRKYRPQDFDQVLGQEHIVTALRGALAGKRIAHAYLFAGSRGTGKTTVARILARAVGCSAADLYEIDAASNRGIDDVRALKEAVDTLPFESPYKVYIIDEVHMLTKEAFNALLKTLEEPPAHVIFILATTEIAKLPETIVSRCQVLLFKKPTHAILRQVVIDTARKEGFTIEPAAADLIALLGDGAFRDTHGILQAVIGGQGGAKEGGAKAGKGGAKSASSGAAITLEDVERITGAPQSTLVNAVLSALDAGDAGTALTTFAKAMAKNADAKTFTEMLLQKARTVLLLRFAKEMEPTLREESSAEEFALLQELAGRSGITSKTVLELLRAADETSRASVRELPLELAIMRLCEK